MTDALPAIFHRRAVKVFEPVEISAAFREQMLDAARHAPSSFNMQPYRLYWVESAAGRRAVAELCYGQRPAATASALVVAVADIGALRSTADLQAEWMRATNIGPDKIRNYERTARLGRIIFAPGPLNLFGTFKWLVFRLINAWKIVGLPPRSRQDLFKWAVKGTALACENLMIAAEALELNTCPMEGFDGRRLARFLGLLARYHEIVMVIAIGKQSLAHPVPPQWRRPIDTTVTVL
ncbi:MAG TPA: nitroreductase family protein [Terriglobales bacterium]|nr:nitroreductase family protein [Terriglobales bacterium]